MVLAKRAFDVLVGPPIMAEELRDRLRAQRGERFADRLVLVCQQAGYENLVINMGQDLDTVRGREAARRADRTVIVCDADTAADLPRLLRESNALLERTAQAMGDTYVALPDDAFGPADHEVYCGIMHDYERNGRVVPDTYRIAFLTPQAE